MPARILIIEARYYDDIADELLAGAQAAIAARGATSFVVTVPGALEIPAALAIALAGRDRQPFDGAVALGCVIRGETSHYDIVAGESARGLIDLSVQHRLPVGNAILTVNTMEQAVARGARDRGNKGADAAEAMFSLLALQRSLTQSA
jgi:6,7-dimethyl-8-ribityllumazine synthase